MEINNAILWIFIKEALHFNNKKVLRAIDYFGSAKALYQAEDFMRCSFLSKEEIKNLSRKKLSLAWEIYGDCVENHIRVLTLDDDDYPKLLRQIDNPPSPLFYRGNLPQCLSRPPFTIVGTRSCNGYGEQMTNEIAAALSYCGFTIVCGVADGIDFFACKAALQADSGPIAVLPFGLLSNTGPKTRLFHDISIHGALVSEVFPRNSSHRFSYHERNRILSGLSYGTLVVQAPKRSGALMTANYAYEQNREVFAVMANAAPETEGSNQLIKDGCQPITDFTDILQVYLPKFGDRLTPLQSDSESVISLQEDQAAQKLQQFKKKHLKELTDPERSVFGILGLEECSAEHLIEQTGLPVQEVLQCLTALEFRGLAVSCPGSKFKVIL